MKKGIITDEWDKCFLCGSPYILETHHAIHGVGNRKCADKFGLVVPLCHICHTNLHDHGFHDRELQALAQEKFEETYPDKDFLKIFGRYYKWQ